MGKLSITEFIMLYCSIDGGERAFVLANDQRLLTRVTPIGLIDINCQSLMAKQKKKHLLSHNTHRELVVDQFRL